MQVKKPQVELDLEQWTGSKLGKEYIKAVYCHPASYMQSTSWEMLGWKKHKLEARLPGEIYTMEYYSAIKKNTFESVLMRWMKLEPIIQSEVSQKEKHQYSLLTHIYGI